MTKPEKSYKGLNPIEREMDGDYQKDVETLVQREVYYCVSGLVLHLIEINIDDNSELVPVCWRDDYEEPAEWFIENGMDLDDMVEYIANQDYSLHDPEDMEKCRKQTKNIARGDWQDFCDDFRIDPHQIEAYEHWIVSDWLADKLEAMGEMVLKDFHGLTIWGRCTTGQAIHMDGVICRIYNELHEEDILGIECTLEGVECSI